MGPNANKSDNETEAKEDLKSFPMPELKTKLGSSPDGSSEAEVQNRLIQYGPSKIKEKANPFLKFLAYFLMFHPVDDRKGGDPVVVTTVEDRYLLLVVWFNKISDQLVN